MQKRRWIVENKWGCFKKRLLNWRNREFKQNLNWRQIKINRKFKSLNLKKNNLNLRKLKGNLRIKWLNIENGFLNLELRMLNLRKKWRN